jgi:hypothetical protein
LGNHIGTHKQLQAVNEKRVAQFHRPLSGGKRQYSVSTNVTCTYQHFSFATTESADSSRNEVTDLAVLF